jgi:UDP-N-acetyl-D-glucosamine/UDP-N-acetyl-D-galactosamine dehydrogenase
MSNTIQKVLVSVFGEQASHPFLATHQFTEEYGLNLETNIPANEYDAIILAVPHEKFLHLKEADFAQMGNPKPIFIDIKGAYKDNIKNLPYWSL